MAKDDLARQIIDVLVELQPHPGSPQQRVELALADLDRLPAQVLTVDLQEVEGEQENGAIGAPVAQPVEARQAVAVVGDRLPVYQRTLSLRNAPSIAARCTPMDRV